MDTGQLTAGTQAERDQFEQYAEKCVLWNEYYLNLIDWSDPHDPIQKLILPNGDELNMMDRIWAAVNEFPNGAEINRGGDCFRIRLSSDEALTDSEIEAGLQQIAANSEISSVMLTGEDGLTLTTPKLRDILTKASEIDHVRIIRFGSRMPVMNPMRIYEDEDLLETIKQHSSSEKRIYVMAHINHPRELTAEAKRGFTALQQAGAVVVNQTPVLKGINDDPDVLSDLLDQLSWAGVTPYDLFIHRPEADNSDSGLPLSEAYRIVEQAKARTSGLGKRVRLSMSHPSGKIEIVAIKDGKAYLKYLRSGHMLTIDCPEEASWFDDLPDHEQDWNQPEKEAGSNASADVPEPKTWQQTRSTWHVIHD
ncbi:KamA family radical SAM protein [Paenibacillus montanisoli]|uniref:KamA family radical SAM protein n=2 Tax=Paenibacillus montanisoli TaxID=2081970 RepID=A0A328U4P4_9BACL|nr:KamA family radical SAM protein [Paenibacillus montanisoli]